MGIWDKLHNFATTCNELSSKLEEKQQSWLKMLKTMLKKNELRIFIKLKIN